VFFIDEGMVMFSSGKHIVGMYILIITKDLNLNFIIIKINLLILNVHT